MEHPYQWAITKLRCYKWFHYYPRFWEIHIPKIIARAFSFALAFLHKLLICLLKERIESIVIPSKTWLSSYSMTFPSILAVRLILPDNRRWLLPVFAFIYLLFSQVTKMEGEISNLSATDLPSSLVLNWVESSA